MGLTAITGYAEYRAPAAASSTMARLRTPRRAEPLDDLVLAVHAQQIRKSDPDTFDFDQRLMPRGLRNRHLDEAEHIGRLTELSQHPRLHRSRSANTWLTG